MRGGLSLGGGGGGATDLTYLCKGNVASQSEWSLFGVVTQGGALYAFFFKSFQNRILLEAKKPCMAVHHFSTCSHVLDVFHNNIIKVY